MKIAFDGTVLHGRKSGVGYYCEELLAAMLQINHGDEFLVFSHQRLNTNFASANGNLKFSHSIRMPIRALYLHAVLPTILNREKPDLCHYTNFLAPIVDDRPYVVTIHDMGLEVLQKAHPLAKRVYTRRLIPRVACRAKLILANSEYSKWDIVRRLGIPEERIRVTPLAASPEFKPTPSHCAAPYFLFVGNVEPRKNLERLIEAFARVPEKDYELLIAGNHWYRAAEVHAKARSMGLNGRVKFLGYVPREDLPALYSGATAFVYPSLLEGFGLPVIEAMACGAPVITSDGSALKEVAGDAAVLVNPESVGDITDALVRVAENEGERAELSKRGLARAAQFSWTKTAELTLDAYRQAIRPSPVAARRPLQKGEAGEGQIRDAIERTIAYANLFQYPLTVDEIRERLFDVAIDQQTFQRVVVRMNISASPDLVRLRASREQISDRGIREVQPALQTLASFPFVRMLAFSGATAHRNMTTPEDVDLFMVVEDGKVWAIFLLAMVWAKVRGLRRRLCMNYVISDGALAIAEDDVFTAQQIASLKPIYGKPVYDTFLSFNPFVRRRFPNFEPSRHRETYAEIRPKAYKRFAEVILRAGPIQLLERFSRVALGWHLRKKIRESSDVQLDARRLKLHLRSHKMEILSEAHPSEFAHSSRE
jgi:glycosyltransferase involved in cell wall biosynthesis